MVAGTSTSKASPPRTKWDADVRPPRVPYATCSSCSAVTVQLSRRISTTTSLLVNECQTHKYQRLWNSKNSTSYVTPTNSSVSSSLWVEVWFTTWQTATISSIPSCSHGVSPTTALRYRSPHRPTSSPKSITPFTRNGTRNPYHNSKADAKLWCPPSIFLYGKVTAASLNTIAPSHYAKISTVVGVT